MGGGVVETCSLIFRLSHHVLTLVVGGKLHLAPLEKNKIKVSQLYAPYNFFASNGSSCG